MIIDKLENIRFYGSILHNLEEGLAAIQALETLEVGTYLFEGGYFMVQEGSTKPMEGNLEVHRKYVDVQMILEGSEEMAWQELKDLKTEESYSPERDVEFLSGSLDRVMKISAGMFYAVFPQDGHKPGSHTKEQQQYKKIVMKLPVE